MSNAPSTIIKQTTADQKPGSLLRKLRQILIEETNSLHVRLLLIRALMAPLPRGTFSRLRAHALRWAGFRIGHGTLLSGMPTITGGRDLYQRLSIGQFSYLNFGCILDLEENITIGNHVALGHEVMILTSTHEIGSHTRRADPELRHAPVTIGDGAWLGSRCLILPGVTIGAGAIVGAGVVVSRDVPPDTLVSRTQRISLPPEGARASKDACSNRSDS